MTSVEVCNESTNLATGAGGRREFVHVPSAACDPPRLPQDRQPARMHHAAWLAEAPPEPVSSGVPVGLLLSAGPEVAADGNGAEQLERHGLIHLDRLIDGLCEQLGREPVVVPACEVQRGGAVAFSGLDRCAVHCAANRGWGRRRLALRFRCGNRHPTPSITVSPEERGGGSVGRSVPTPNPTTSELTPFANPRTNHARSHAVERTLG